MKYIFYVLIVVFLMFGRGYSGDTNKGIDPKVLQQWDKIMKFGISDQRKKLIKAITTSKSTEAYHLIENAVSADLNSGVRGEAVYSMINLKLDKASIWTHALKTEKDTEVLRRVVYGVQELKISGTGNLLFIIMTNYAEDSKENFLTAATIRAIGNLEYKPAGNYIYTLLTNFAVDTEIRSAAAIAIGTLGSEHELEQIEFIVDNPGEDKAVRMYSAYALGKSGNTKYIELLFKLIANDKEDLNVRLWSIAGLEYIKDPLVEDKLIELCKVDHQKVRIKAIQTLGNMKSKKAEKILTFKAKYDPEIKVKNAAKKALLDMGIDLDKIAEEKKKKEAEEKTKQKKEEK